MSKLTSNYIFAFVFINAQSCIEKNLVETEQTCLLLKFKFFAVKFLREKKAFIKNLFCSSHLSRFPGKTPLFGSIVWLMSLSVALCPMR